MAQPTPATTQVVVHSQVVQRRQLPESLSGPLRELILACERVEHRLANANKAIALQQDNEQTLQQALAELRGQVNCDQRTIAEQKERLLVAHRDATRRQEQIELLEGLLQDQQQEVSGLKEALQRERDARRQEVEALRQRLAALQSNLQSTVHPIAGTPAKALATQTGQGAASGPNGISSLGTNSMPLPAPRQKDPQSAGREGSASSQQPLSEGMQLPTAARMALWVKNEDGPQHAELSHGLLLPKLPIGAFWEGPAAGAAPLQASALAVPSWDPGLMLVELSGQDFGTAGPQQHSGLGGSQAQEHRPCQRLIGSTALLQPAPAEAEIPGSGRTRGRLRPSLVGQSSGSTGPVTRQRSTASQGTLGLSSPPVSAAAEAAQAGKTDQTDDRPVVRAATVSAGGSQGQGGSDGRLKRRAPPASPAQPAQQPQAKRRVHRGRRARGVSSEVGPGAGAAAGPSEEGFRGEDVGGGCGRGDGGRELPYGAYSLLTTAADDCEGGSKSHVGGTEAARQASQRRGRYSERLQGLKASEKQ